MRQKKPSDDSAFIINLHQMLNSKLDAEELRTLCLYLAVDYDDLEGESKTAKSRELIKYLDKRDRIPNLAKTGKILRPDIPWPIIPQAVKEPSEPPASTILERCKPQSRIVIVGPAALVLIIVVLILLNQSNSNENNKSTQSQTTQTALAATIPSTHTPVPIATQLPTLGDTWTRPIDGMVMVYVPSRTLQMGSDDDAINSILELCNQDIGH